MDSLKPFRSAYAKKPLPAPRGIHGPNAPTTIHLITAIYRRSWKSVIILEAIAFQIVSSTSPLIRKNACLTSSRNGYQFSRLFQTSDHVGSRNQPNNCKCLWAVSELYVPTIQWSNEALWSDKIFDIGLTIKKVSFGIFSIITLLWLPKKEI